MDEFRDRFRAEYGFVMENARQSWDDARVRGVAKSEVNLKVSGGKGSSAEIRRIAATVAVAWSNGRNRRRRRTLKARKAGQKRPYELLDLYPRDEIIGPR